MFDAHGRAAGGYLHERFQGVRELQLWLGSIWVGRRMTGAKPSNITI